MNKFIQAGVDDGFPEDWVEEQLEKFLKLETDAFVRYLRTIEALRTKEPFK